MKNMQKLDMEILKEAIREVLQEDRNLLKAPIQEIIQEMTQPVPAEQKSMSPQERQKRMSAIFEAYSDVYKKLA